MDDPELASPDRYPLTFDPATDRIEFIILNEAAYGAASFLDQRLMETAPPGQWMSASDVQAAAAPLSGECDFIFHIGHVGSTLLSRLLGLHPRVFSLREPAVLRTLAQLQTKPDPSARVDARVRLFLTLWARVYRPEQKTLLKATSFATEIGPQLMHLNPGARAILMFVSPSVYLAGILAGDASREELRALASSRLDRLHRRLGHTAWRVEALGEGEIAAMSWLTEIAAIAEVAAAGPQRVLWLEFEAFLARPAEGLAACLRRLHGEAAPDAVEAMLRSPEMTRYSKAPEFSYDANLRRRVLAQAADQHAAEIARGIAWLNAAGNAHPALADVMRRVGAAARAAAAG